ncbi:ATP synthase subunit I [Saccharospirillum mangrovi]|uniref:ATP synthase subunit I n=1 Tax=Saccharospirillum mangrovi TaxID=2161747 RepID=UPI001300B0B8|nr:ATP synthase subunit I [Saccharospirillum mangrovi]
MFAGLFWMVVFSALVVLLTGLYSSTVALSVAWGAGIYCASQLVLCLGAFPLRGLRHVTDSIKALYVGAISRFIVASVGFALAMVGEYSPNTAIMLVVFFVWTVLGVLLNQFLINPRGNR